MKTTTKFLMAAVLTAVSGSALAAPQQAATLDQLLNQVRNASSENSALNRQRERQFVQENAQQAQILAEAKKALANEQARNRQLKASFDANQQKLDGLVNQLRTREGDFSKVFDSARQAASDLKNTLEQSLVSAQYVGRGVSLARMAESRDLPSLDDLHQLWFLMQQEMVEEGKVAKFPATITREDGTRIKTSVVRVGVFDAVNGDSFLRYLPETGALVEFNRQPAGGLRSLAAQLSSATSGVLPMAVDPTGGQLLATLVNQPSAWERIGQGQVTGWIIIVLGLIGVLVILERGAYLLLAGSKLKAQMNSSKPDLNNPLGRILTVFNESKSDDAESLELRMDEAIMKERPVISARIGVLRIIALLTVLLGLLGTVVGVMNTFQSMNLFGGSTPLIANGISGALVTTWLGLLVAVVMLFFHGLLSSRSERLMQVLEQQTANFIASRAEKLAAARAQK
ncbi:MAG TPA: MotA/TolQ/ExbB proton channel family protein [Gammaproteobacteria bacterium]|nr:MotA/TolQ/ExbB proton channel family protein [Gammaproteobacteria bacterium]